MVPVSEACTGDSYAVANIAEIHRAEDSLALVLDLNCDKLFVSPQRGDLVCLISQKQLKVETQLEILDLNTNSSQSPWIQIPGRGRFGLESVFCSPL